MRAQGQKQELRRTGRQLRGYCENVDGVLSGARDESQLRAAHGRAELRQWLREAESIDRPKIEGIALGAKLENGMTAAWLVSQAKSIPAVVGRDE